MATYPIFGDTDGTLSGSARGASQELRGPDIPDGSRFAIYGDASVITDTARGGNDWIVGPKLPGGGGSFADLYGDAGTLSGHGRGGNDAVFASDGPRNEVFGDADTITDHGRGGNDLVVGASGPGNFSFIYGDANTLMMFGQGGNDLVIAGTGGAQNWMAGDAQGMLDNSRGGNDTVIGFGRMAGDAIYMLNNSHGGNDLLVAVAQGGLMYGDAQEVRQNSGSAAHVVCGNDTLVSGTGNDDMWGDVGGSYPGTVTGADTFVFNRNSGHDAIEDFETGKDKVDLRAYAVEGVHGVVDLSMAATEAGYVVALPDGSSVTFHGMTPVASDILFA